MDYVHGESLARLWRLAMERSEPIPLAVTVGVMAGALHGLDAAHEATSESGESLHIVHRDVSPQNILIGTNGIARILDFGVAKAEWRLHTTRDGSLKGKLRYMAPEQLRGAPVDRRVDVFTASVVLWETLTGRRVFEGDDPNIYVARLLDGQVESPLDVAPHLPAPLAEIVMRGLASDPADRFDTAREMARALETTMTPASAREIGDWVERTAGAELQALRARVAALEKLGHGTGGEVLPGPLTDRVDAAAQRLQRAQLPTLPPDATDASGASARSGHEVTAPKIEPPAAARHAAVRRRRAAMIVVLTLVVLTVGVWLARAPRASSVASTAIENPATATAEAVSYDASPSPAASSANRLGASVVTSVAGSEAEPPSPRKPSRSPAQPKSPRPTPSAQPTTTAKSALCMKQRADGVVYFEPCP